MEVAIREADEPPQKVGMAREDAAERIRGERTVRVVARTQKGFVDRIQ
jgi:hypothetical protein